MNLITSKLFLKIQNYSKGFNFTGFLDKMITSLLTNMDRTNIILYYSTLFFRQTTAVIGKKEPENKNGFFQP